MRKIFVSLLFVGGAVGLAAPAGAAPSERACNAGTMRAHHTVPAHATQAHASIPHCM